MSKSKKPAAPKPAAEEENFVPCCGQALCLDCTVDAIEQLDADPLADAASTASSEPLAYTEDDQIIVADEAEAVKVLAALNLDPVGFYTVQDGDTYPGIAKRNKPEGMTVNEYARHLVELNKNRPLLPGSIIKL